MCWHRGSPTVICTQRLTARALSVVRLLLLGGTAEARHWRPVASRRAGGQFLGGRVPDPALPSARCASAASAASRDCSGGWRLRSTRWSTRHTRSRRRSPRTRRACRELGHPPPAGPPSLAAAPPSWSDPTSWPRSRCWKRLFMVLSTTGRSGERLHRLDAWFLIRAVTPPDAGVMPLRRNCCCRRPLRPELNLLRGTASTPWSRRTAAVT